jgi:DNA-directed RNA polymerase subunit RPC12/RpoP
MPWDDQYRYRDCTHCGVRLVAMEHHTTIDTESSLLPRRGWSLISCPRCAGAVLLEHSPSNISNIYVSNVFPSEDRDVDVSHLPEDVSSYYRDAIRAMDASLPDAAAVQLRRTLEAAAAHFGHDNGPLIRRVRDLITEGLITKTFGEVLNEVRRLGNLGAHATDERVDEAEATRALRFTTQVLRNLFEIPTELEQIRESQSVAKLDASADNG